MDGVFKCIDTGTMEPHGASLKSSTCIHRMNVGRDIMTIKQLLTFNVLDIFRWSGSSKSYVTKEEKRDKLNNE